MFSVLYTYRTILALIRSPGKDMSYFFSIARERDHFVRERDLFVRERDNIAL